MKIKLELDIKPAKDGLKGFYSRVEGGMSEKNAAASALIAKVEGPAGFVDTVPTRAAMCADKEIVKALKVAAGWKDPAAKPAEKPAVKVAAKPSDK